jgi:hypothetical protein
MRQVMVHRADQRRLPIAVPGPLYPRPRRRPRCPPVAARQHPPPPRRAVRQADRDPRRIRRLRRHRGARHMRDPRRGRDRREERCIQMPVLDHMAHCPVFDLGRQEIEEQRRRAFVRPPVAGPDPQDCLRRCRQRGPDPDGLQQPPRRDGQRIGPPVERCLRPRPRRLRVNQGHAQPRLRQRQCQRRPVQPAAHDQNVRLPVHDPDSRGRGGIVHAMPCR